jgi:hypothetical protein
MAGQHLAHIVLAGVRILGQELRRGDKDAGGAKAALQGVMTAESFLQVVELAIGLRQPLHRDDHCALDLRGEQQTRTHGAAIDQDGAGAADAVLAPDMGSGLMQHVTQHIRHLHARLGLRRHAAAVEREVDCPAATLRTSS